MDLATLIDHTLLRCDATAHDIAALCHEALTHGFATVCVNTTWVPQCAALVANSRTAVCAVVGFPLGAMARDAKAYEAHHAVRQGATEIDMVMNIGALKSHDYETVLEDMRGVVRAATPSVVKVILETSALTHEEKLTAASLAQRAGAAFVKTSTGFGSAGATVADVQLLRSVVGNAMGVKASGGIRTTETALAMVEAGATRLGTSASVAIVTGNSRPNQKGY